MTTDSRVLAKSQIPMAAGIYTLWHVTDEEVMTEYHLNGSFGKFTIVKIVSSNRYVMFNGPEVIEVSLDNLNDLVTQHLRPTHPSTESEIALWFGWKAAATDPPPTDGESFYAFVPELYDKKLNPDAVVECTHVDDGKGGYYVAAVWNDKTHSYDSKIVKPAVWREISSPIEVSPREYEIYQLLSKVK